MYHHAESPEVIHAKLAEWERTVATHQAQCEAERLLTNSADLSSSHPLRLLIGRLQHVFRPATRWHDQIAD